MTDDETKKSIYRWFDKSEIDYTEHYIHLYISYNAWFTRVTGAATDRDALLRLQKRFVIWDDYERGKTLHSLRHVMQDIKQVSSMVESEYDWRGLIRFWYDVRCRLFHGATIDLNSRTVRYAYESLYIFMSEIIRRMRACFDEEDEKLLAPLRNPEKFRRIQERLYEKYITSAKIWEVDMTRV